MKISLRPQKLIDYIGQEHIKKMLHIYIQAAKHRKEPLDHLLFYGAPGLGKTTLAYILANELNAKIKIISAPALEKIGDLASLLASLEENDILFIDEIHHLSKTLEEALYSVLEDNVLDIMIDKQDNARNIRIDLPFFTLIGATTKLGNISEPLRERFGILFHLEDYSLEELQKITKKNTTLFNMTISSEASLEIAKRSRGNPRILNRFLKRIRDFAHFRTKNNINQQIVLETFAKMHIDDLGLTKLDYFYLSKINQFFPYQAVGLSTIATILNEEPKTLTDICEPFLIKKGFLKKTPRGRMLTESGITFANKITQKEQK